MFTSFKLIIFYIFATISMIVLIILPFSKESLINTYNSVIEFFGNNSLTKDRNLQGKRTFGIDHYVGTYNANYNLFTGKEVLFGGTILKRKGRSHIDIKIKLEKKSGEIKIINRLGEKDTLAIENTGNYEDSIYIEGVSYYLIVEANNFEGSLKVVIE